MDLDLKPTAQTGAAFRLASSPRPRESSRGDGLGRSLDRGREYLLGLQQPDGHWCAEIEGDTILESEYVLAMHFLGRGREPKVEKAAAFLRRRRLEQGGWAIYPDGPPDVSSTVKAYFALKLVGDDPDAEHMRKAREQILRLGGLDATNSFTKIYLAIFGQYEWERAPAVPPELILFPKWFPFNIYEISSWSRAIVVPLSIVWACRPHRPVPALAQIPELRAPAGATPAKPPATATGRHWARFFVNVDRGIKHLERLGLTPARARALRRAERWVLDRLPKSEGLGAIFPPILNTVMALDCLGYAHDDPILASQIAELEKLEIEEDGTLRLQPCRSPLWDTALSINALADVDPAGDASALVAASNWILDREVTEPGDWRVKSPDTQVGGWYFEYANEFYPDTDDTAQILTALSKVPMTDDDASRRSEVVDRAWAWLLGMQNRDGGWGSFDRGCDKVALTYIPFADHNAMIDPSTSDITARVVEALARWRFDLASPPVRRAIGFLLAEQESDGSWFGRWGCNYIYGTYLALWGLAAAGEDMTADWARRAVAWLRDRQNLDGGWGELPSSYAPGAERGRGPSTPSQTAWALLGLLAAGEGASTVVGRGIGFLMDRQREDGGWDEREWTGTGFPEVFYLKYHYYPIYFPLLALATFRREMEGRVGALAQET